MASTSAGRRGMRRRWAAGMLAVPLLLVVGCGRSGDDRIPENRTGGVAVTDGDGTPKNTEPASGDFGTLKDVCGPGDGKPLQAPTRGVTDSEITVGVTGDPQNQAQPGLGQEFFDMSEGFVKWCNEAGGINGRKIKLNKRDAKLFDVGKVMTDACQTDFMLVGGGNPMDAQGVEQRLKCNLGAFPAYVVSPSSAQSAQQVLAVGLPTSTVVTGGWKAIFDKYPGSQAKVGLLGQDMPDLSPVMDRYEQGIKALGGTIVNKQLAPVMNAPWRTYIEQMKSADVQVLVTTWLAVDSAQLFQEMNAVGWAPKVLVSEQSGYNRFTLSTAKAAKLPDTYVYTAFVPQELADKNPAAKTAVDMLHSVKADAHMDFFHMSGINSWLLFATAVKACGADVSQQCVLQKALQPKWDAGGLFAPGPVTDAAGMRAGDCFTMLKVTDKGFEYDAEITKPNTAEIFNCGPGNVAEIAPGAPPAQTPPAADPPTTTDPPATTDGSTSGTTGDTSLGATSGTTGDTSTGSSSGATGDTSLGATDGSTTGTTGDTSTGSTDGSTGDTSLGSTDGSTGDTSLGSTDGSTTGTTGDGTSTGSLA